jgi:ferritin
MDQTLVGAIEKHVALEAGNVCAYLTAYSWARANGFEGFAKRWKNDARDEEGHAQNWAKYAARRHAAISVSADIGAVDTGGIQSISRSAAELEEATTKSMEQLALLADEVGDPDAAEYISAKLIDQTKEAKCAWDFAERVADLTPAEIVLADRMIENGDF